MSRFKRQPGVEYDSLFRMNAPIAEFRFQDDGDGNTLVGYAARFDEPTTIDSWEGRFVEVIRHGAFAKTITGRRDDIKVLYDHGMDPSIGNKPIAVLRTIREDETGLWIEAEFIDTTYARDIREAVRAGAITGMSFRFTVVVDEWEFPDDGDDVRTLVEVRLYELGPVTFPAYEATTAGVRTAAAYNAWRSFAANDSRYAGPFTNTNTSNVTGPAAATPDEPDGPAFDATRAQRQIRVARSRVTRFLNERN